jgi:hypothetical protein
MLTVTLADKSGLKWAQEQVLQHHYLHTPVDARCSPVAMLVKLFDRSVGCLIFGRPEATRVNGWYGSVEDAQTGRCQLTRWEILNLVRVWLDPSLQPEGEWYHPQGFIGPSVLPGFYDRKRHWHSTTSGSLLTRVKQNCRDREHALAQASGGGVARQEVGARATSRSSSA